MQKFSDIIGHDLAIRSLKDAVINNTPAHAYLFTGIEGVGKKATAIAFLRALFCVNHEDGDACGHCEPCRKIEHGNHPDFHFIEPTIRDKKVKEEIDITTARELVERLSYRPYEASIKGMIIDGAEKMNIQAANALLKTLEEPPGRSVIILVTSNPRLLLPTIVSRLRAITFAPVGRDELIPFIQRRLLLSDEETSTIASLTKGAPGKAFMMSEELDKEREERDIVSEMIFNAKNYSAADVFSRANAFDKSKDRNSVDRAILIAQELLRDLTAVKTTGKYDTVINMDLKTELANATRNYTLRKLLSAYEALENLKNARALNINPLLVFSLMALELRK